MADNFYERKSVRFADDRERLANFQRTYGELQTLGRAGYMDLYPQVFKEFGPMRVATPSWQEQKLRELGQLMNEYSGPEGATIRWFIQNRMRDLEYQLDRVRLHKAGVPEDEPMPIPNWMQPYMQTTTMPITDLPTGGRRDLPTTKEVQKLRPLGPQAELNPEQMSRMAGYQAWMGAGSPTKYSENALLQMSDIDRWWSPYVTQSRSMFPKGATKPRWATATQR